MVEHISLWQCLRNKLFEFNAVRLCQNKHGYECKLRTEKGSHRVAGPEPHGSQLHKASNERETEKTKQKRVPVNLILKTKKIVLLSVAQYAHYAANNRLVTFKVKESIDLYRQSLFARIRNPHPHAKPITIAQWKRIDTYELSWNFHDHDIVSGEHRSCEDRKTQSAYKIQSRGVEFESEAIDDADD